MYYSNGYNKLAKRVLDGRGFAKVGTNMVFNPFSWQWKGRDEYASLTKFIDNYGLFKTGVYGVAYMRDQFIAENLENAMKNEVPMILKNLGENPTKEEKQAWWRTNDSKNIPYISRSPLSYILSTSLFNSSLIRPFVANTSCFDAVFIMLSPWLVCTHYAFNYKACQHLYETLF